MSLATTTFGTASLLFGLSGLPAHASSLELNRLDRGHRILIQRGLQLSARVYGINAESRPNDDEFWTDWQASNFTAIDVGGWTPRLEADRENVRWVTWRSNKQDPTQSFSDSFFASGQGQTLVGWQYKDEQDIGDPTELKALETWIKHHRPLLPNTLLYTNQHGDERFGGSGSYEDASLRRYLRRVQPDMLMQDTYPYGVWNDLGNQGGRPAQLLYAMVRYRKFALAGHDGSGRKPIPYGLWVQAFRGSSAIGTWSRFPSESELRQQQFSALTLGYKFISAYTYNGNRSFGTWESPFFSRPLGKGPTPAFRQIAEINRQSLNLGPTLVRLLSTDIRIVPGPPALSDLITPKIPLWNPQADPYMTRLEAQNLGTIYGGRRGDVLVGYFKPLLESFDGPAKNQHYFMLTNGLAGKRHSIEQTRQKLTVEFDFGDSGITGLQRLSRETGNVEAIQAGWTEEVAPGLISRFVSLGDRKYRLTLVLDGGTGDLFKFDTGAPFVGQATGSPTSLTSTPVEGKPQKPIRDQPNGRQP
ncbi:hypothetical protein [Acaryochloris sp. IP29b_bin.148]|uniref:hypothetical protein n=1 Tax=Acaryochloris sp. IP29b_bin.148 TaxID=2969218 RepID=UPI002614B9D4|nr:hypothetical protein [Acaryochloris sp. IP29b_bin.148]